MYEAGINIQTEPRFPAAITSPIATEPHSKRELLQNQHLDQIQKMSHPSIKHQKKKGKPKTKTNKLPPSLSGHHQHRTTTPSFYKAVASESAAFATAQ